MGLKYVCFALAVLIPASAECTPELPWLLFKDERGSSFARPASLFQVKGLPNDVGDAHFRSSDGLTKVDFETVTEERPGFPGNDPDNDLSYLDAQCSIEARPYKVMKAGLSAVSCIGKNKKKIYYAIARYNRGGHSALYIEYPLAQKAYWNSAVRKMSGSLRQQERRGGYPQ